MINLTDSLRRGSSPQLYYPRVPFHAKLSSSPALLARPTIVDPILDPDHTRSPLSPFDASYHASVFSDPSEDGISEPLSPATDLDTRYLVPSLTHNEHLRLTTLWYYTHALEKDAEFLSSLDVLVKTLQKAIGWEFSIAGILDESTYTRLATANLPLAILPRRESTCSHTVNQEPGTIFMITDMSSDWRFKLSPHVEIGGLRSYAGTQLKMTLENGQVVAFGSLCVASNTVQPPLRTEDQATLLHVADMIVSQITSHARQARMRERQKMAEIVFALKSYTILEDLEANIVRSLRQIYSTQNVNFQETENGLINLDSPSPVAFQDFSDGIWEDTGLIKNAIENANFERLNSQQSVRAIAARCGNSQKYLVVDSMDVRHVFDDFDVWFVERCAAILSERIYDQMLLQALQAKEAFLRGFTHQLRTPIHGILGAVDLLADDLVARNMLVTSEDQSVDSDLETFPSAYLSTIRSSGKELMMTINNIIKINALSAVDRSNTSKAIYDLRDLHSAVLEKTLEVTPLSQLSNLSLRVLHSLSQKQCAVVIDPQILIECVEHLMLNAVQAVAAAGGGVVTMTISTSSDGSSFEVLVNDTGAGIKLEDQKRIFNSYAKIDSSKPGAGVGLTLAKRYASQLGGSISLVTSQEGQGSTFRAIFPLPVATSSKIVAEPVSYITRYLPLTFRQDIRKMKAVHMFKHLLDDLHQRGFQKTHTSGSGLVISDMTPGSDDFAAFARGVQEATVLIAYSSLWASKEVLRYSEFVGVIVITGALYPSRLNKILGQADELYKTLSDDLLNVPARSYSVTPKIEEGLTTLNISAQPAPEPRTESWLDDQSITNTAVRLADGTLATYLPAPISISEINATKQQVRALLVDDNSINLRILRMFCDKRSIPFVLAEDGHEATQRYTKSLSLTRSSIVSLGNGTALDPAVCTGVPRTSSTQRINLVLMDLQMPRCSGIEATSAIRALEKTHALAPSVIFMITGQDSRKDRDESIAAGADEFLVKPVRMNVLEKLICKYFGDQIFQK